MLASSTSCQTDKWTSSTHICVSVQEIFFWARLELSLKLSSNTGMEFGCSWTYLGYEFIFYYFRRPGSRIILTGDFNCDDGWENSKPVRYESKWNEIVCHKNLCRYFKGLLGGLPVPPLTLDDTFRTYNGDDVDGTTFPGKPGKIDYVMVDKGAVVRNAWIDRNWADHGHASDHWPVGAVVDLRR